jgi:hypothetical protein
MSLCESSKFKIYTRSFERSKRTEVEVWNSSKFLAGQRGEIGLRLYDGEATHEGVEVAEDAG